MFYVSKKLENGCYEVTDTQDSSKEVYNGKDLVKINKEIPISGVKENSIEEYFPEIYKKSAAKYGLLYGEIPFETEIKGNKVILTELNKAVKGVVKIPYGINFIASVIP